MITFSFPGLPLQKNCYVPVAAIHHKDNLASCEDRGFQLRSEHACRQRVLRVGKAQAGLTYAPQDYGHDGEDPDIPGSDQIINVV